MFLHYFLLQPWLLCLHFTPWSARGGSVSLFVCLINDCRPVFDVCCVVFFNVCVSSVSCTSVPLCLLPLRCLAGLDCLCSVRHLLPPEVNLYLHAPRLAMCFACFLALRAQLVSGVCLWSQCQRCLWVALTPPSLSLSLLTPGDEIYHDIFRDFSHMASNNPEKLKRRSADPKM